MATELCEDVISFTFVGWIWLWTWSFAPGGPHLWHWKYDKQMEYDVRVFTSYAGVWWTVQQRIHNTCLLQGLTWLRWCCWDFFQNCRGDEAFSLSLFLLMTKNILKTVLQWNNKTDGIWGGTHLYLPVMQHLWQFRPVNSLVYFTKVWDVCTSTALHSFSTVLQIYLAVWRFHLRLYSVFNKFFLTSTDSKPKLIQWSRLLWEVGFFSATVYLLCLTLSKIISLKVNFQ